MKGMCKDKVMRRVSRTSCLPTGAGLETRAEPGFTACARPSAQQVGERARAPGRTNEGKGRIGLEASFYVVSLSFGSEFLSCVFVWFHFHFPTAIKS